jgi:hypothetical protein
LQSVSLLQKVFEDWDATKLSSPILVDKMCHQHVLDNKNYIKDCGLRIADCELLFGHVIWHNPDGGLDVETRGERIKTNIIVLRIQYPSGYDEEIRNFGVTQGEMAERARRMPETGEASRPLLTVAGASQSGADSADGAVSCDGNEELVTITVVYLTGECVDFKLKRDVPMRNVFKAFTQPRTLKFPHNGKFIGGDEHRIR